MLGYYVLMHLAGIADRRGLALARRPLRRWIPIARIERGCSARCCGGSFRFVVTEAGGCAVDIDTEHDFDVAKLRYEEWCKAQRARVEQLYGAAAAARARPAASGAARVSDAAARAARCGAAPGCSGCATARCSRCAAPTACAGSTAC